MSYKLCTLARDTVNHCVPCCMILDCYNPSHENTIWIFLTKLAHINEVDLEMLLEQSRFDRLPTSLHCLDCWFFWKHSGHSSQNKQTNKWLFTVPIFLSAWCPGMLCTEVATPITMPLIYGIKYSFPWHNYSTNFPALNSAKNITLLTTG